MNRFLMTAVFLAGALSGRAHAGDTCATGEHVRWIGMPAAMSVAAKLSTDRVVRGFDRDATTITVEHRPIRKLGAAAATIPHHAKDRAILAAVKPGNTVNLSADNLDDAYSVMILQHAQ